MSGVTFHLAETHFSKMVGFTFSKFQFQSLEYSSLMTGLGASMPDVEEEEVDSCQRPLPMLTVQPSAAESALSDEIEDEFLPRVDPSCNQLLLEELDDEEANSALCK